jgi:hypothetical protein
MLILYLTFVVASVSFTITETKLFLPFREFLRLRSEFLYNLFCCSYCIAHWLAFILVFIYQPRLLYFWAPLDYFLTAIVIVWLAIFQNRLLCILFDWTE